MDLARLLAARGAEHRNVATQMRPASVRIELSGDALTRSGTGVHFRPASGDDQKLCAFRDHNGVGAGEVAGVTVAVHDRDDADFGRTCQAVPSMHGFAE